MAGARADGMKVQGIGNGAVANDVASSAEPKLDVGWVRAHEALCELARERAKWEGREGPWLLRAVQAEVHRHLGFGSFAQYAEHWFGYGLRTLEDKLRTARALESLPRLAHALEEGCSSWSAVKELARVATPETESDWLCAAEGKSARTIEKLVSGRVRGDRPSDATRPEAQRHVLRFEVAAETLATFREALKAVRQDCGGPLDDDAALLLMARAVLSRAHEPVSDAGRASYQVAVMLCEHCGESSQRAGADSVPLHPEVAEMVACDAQRVVVDEPVTHVGGVAARRATQDVAPAVRRQVVLRDRGKCVVPGCRHSTFVDVHHLVQRAEGGSHTADNLVVLCGAHHRAVHRGTLVITGNVIAGKVIAGNALTGVDFRHADGTPYGGHVSASAVAVREQVLGGLVRLGFRERDALGALDRVGATGTPSAKELLRSALLLLTTQRASVRVP